jgi:hypothetical protein
MRGATLPRPRAEAFFPIECRRAVLATAATFVTHRFQARRSSSAKWRSRWRQYAGFVWQIPAIRQARVCWPQSARARKKACFFVCARSAKGSVGASGGMGVSIRWSFSRLFHLYFVLLYLTPRLIHLLCINTYCPCLYDVPHEFTCDISPPAHATAAVLLLANDHGRRVRCSRFCRQYRTRCPKARALMRSSASSVITMSPRRHSPGCSAVNPSQARVSRRSTGTGST